MQIRTRKDAAVNVVSREKNTPWLLIGLLLALLAFSSLSLAACGTAPALVSEAQAASLEEISVDEAFQKYQEGTFFLDVRTLEEWDEYHVPNTTLIPLDELESRLDELPQDEEIVVICRSGNRSQVGRDILRTNGVALSTSMSGGIKEWSAAGYPVE